MNPQPFILGRLQGHGFQFGLVFEHPPAFMLHLGNDFPATPIQHQGALVSDKGNPMVAPVIPSVNTGGVFPEECKPVKFINGLQGVRGFRSILRVGKFPP